MRYYILYKIIRWFLLDLRPSIQAIPFVIVPLIDHGFAGWQLALVLGIGWWIFANAIQYAYYARATKR